MHHYHPRMPLELRTLIVLFPFKKILKNFCLILRSLMKSFFFFNQNKTMLVWALNSKEPNFYRDDIIGEL